MNRIRELRKQMDMTQRELAKYLKVADSTLSYWEMGRYEPDNEALMKLSGFFRVPVDYILGGDFTKWDITGSDMFVSESKAVYTTNRIEFEGLTNEETDLLAEYAEFIKSRRNPK